MARSNFREPPSKTEKKLVKAGILDMSREACGPVKAGKVHIGPAKSYATRRAVFDGRRPSQSSKNSTWLHAVGFVVLAAIVISWALGY